MYYVPVYTDNVHVYTCGVPSMDEIGSLVKMAALNEESSVSLPTSIARTG